MSASTSYGHALRLACRRYVPIADRCTTQKASLKNLVGRNCEQRIRSQAQVALRNLGVANVGGLSILRILTLQGGVNLAHDGKLVIERRSRPEAAISRLKAALPSSVHGRSPASDPDTTVLILPLPLKPSTGLTRWARCMTCWSHRRDSRRQMNRR